MKDLQGADRMSIFYDKVRKMLLVMYPILVYVALTMTLGRRWFMCQRVAQNWLLGVIFVLGCSSWIAFMLYVFDWIDPKGGQGRSFHKLPNFTSWRFAVEHKRYLWIGGIVCCVLEVLHHVACFLHR